MKYLKSVLFILAIFLSVGIFAANSFSESNPTIGINDSKALDFYKNSQVITYDRVFSVGDLAGSLIYIKEGDSKEQYLNILPEEVKKNLKPVIIDKLVYHSMVTHEFAAKVSYLVFFTTTINKNNLLEVVLQDSWQLQSPSWLGNSMLTKRFLAIGKELKKQGYRIKFCNAVQYSTLTTRVFENTADEVKGSFTYITGDGKKYKQSNDFTMKEIISIEANDITDLLNIKDIDNELINPKSTEISLREKFPILNVPVKYEGETVPQITPNNLKTLKSILTKVK